MKKGLYILFFGFCSSAGAVVSTGVDEAARLPYWELRDTGISLRLVQRLPDQTRGYFLARGFEMKHVERIALSCVFQTVFKNISHKTKPDPIVYDVRDWVVIYKGEKRSLKIREDWSTEWQKEKVSQSARLAFEWSLMPTQQEYQPGDYNWGMSAFNLAPGSVFDLEVVWKQYGKINRSLIRGITCSPDIHPEPGDIP